MAASFHAYVCMTQWLACIVGFIWGLSDKELWEPLWWVSLLGLFLLPVINELVLNLKSLLCKSRVLTPQYSERYNLKECLPIVYSPEYNIHAFGIEKCHPFDSTKYRRVFQDLVDSGLVNQTTHRIHEPEIPSREFLQQVMSPWYLFLLNYSIKVTQCVEVPLFFLPGWFLRMRVLDPMMRAARGSVDAACIARHKGWAINLSGGYHHATRDNGGGFCIYPDITFVTSYMEQWFGLKRFLIIDLDAHQGNGHERDHMDKEKYYIIDAYNHDIYPGDAVALPAISDNIRVHRSTTDAEYLRMVENSLAKAFETFKPDFVIYNAGTDCMRGDPLGCLKISEQGIVDRDEVVFRHAVEVNKVPILMVLSGGYQMTNAPVIADSIRNLDAKFNLLTSN